MFPEIQERGGHLLYVIDFGPPLIGRALALGHALLNIDDQIDAPGRGRAVLGQLRDGPLPGNRRPDVIGIKTGAQGRSPQAGVLILPRGQERDRATPPMLHLKAGLLHEPQKRREVGGLLLQSRHDPQPHPLLGRGWLFTDPLSIMEKAALAVLLRILNNRQLVLNAHPVREPPHRKAGADKVMEFPGTVLGGGVVINVIVNVALVNVGADEELILALCPAHGCFIADLICLLRRDLAGRERLPDLKEQGPALHGPARFRLVLAFQQQELSGGGCGITEIGRHGPQLFRIEPISKPLLHCLDGRFPSRYLVGPDVGCSDSRTSFPSRKNGRRSVPPAARNFWTKCPEVSACHKIHRRILHTIKALHQPATQGREPKGRNQERQHEHGDAACGLPGQQAKDRQQGQAHTRHNAHSARHAGQKREHRHGEDQGQNKGGRDNF